MSGAQDVVVIGAGIAGLCAAGELVRAGRRVLVVEKSRGIGGRMATRRVGGAVCDHGAQFFTVRGRAFGGLVADAEAAGAVATWCTGFGRAASLGADVGPAADGHARWRGVRGMTDLPKFLLERLAADGHGEPCLVSTNTRVAGIGARDDRVVVTVEAEGRSATIEAAAAVVTAPVPQALDLFAAGGAVIDAAARAALVTVAYDPCFALLLVLDRPSLVPPPGAIQFAADAGGPLAWVADNMQKGISAVPALTVHATGAFSRDHFDAPPEEVTALLLDAVRPWIDGDPATAVVERSLHRWKFALPTTILDSPLVAASQAPPIVCCGDAFAGPRVEGAASSGLAAGRWLARRLVP
ncbi:MAG: NAD(P)/FAD-dependent oxidoreductase [Planctomycetaceae bacterium]